MECQAFQGKYLINILVRDLTWWREQGKRVQCTLFFYLVQSLQKYTCDINESPSDNVSLRHFSPFVI